MPPLKGLPPNTITLAIPEFWRGHLQTAALKCLHLRFEWGSWVGCKWVVLWMRTTVPRAPLVSHFLSATGPTIGFLHRLIISHIISSAYCSFGFLIWIFIFLKIRGIAPPEVQGAGSCLNGLGVLNKWLMSADSPQAEESQAKTCFRINICDFSSSSCLVMYGVFKMLTVCTLIDASV